MNEEVFALKCHSSKRCPAHTGLQDTNYIIYRDKKENKLIHSWYIQNVDIGYNADLQLTLKCHMLVSLTSTWTTLPSLSPQQGEPQQLHFRDTVNTDIVFLSRWGFYLECNDTQYSSTLWPYTNMQTSRCRQSDTTSFVQFCQRKKSFSSVVLEALIRCSLAVLFMELIKRLVWISC